MSERDWIDGAEAARILDVPRLVVDRLVGEGLIGTRLTPRTYKRFRRSDCEALARVGIALASPTENVHA